MMEWHSDFALVVGEENKQQVVKLMEDATAHIKDVDSIPSDAQAVKKAVRRAATSAWRLGWEKGSAEAAPKLPQRVEDLEHERNNFLNELERERDKNNGALLADRDQWMKYVDRLTAKADGLERDLMTALEQKDKLAAEMEEWKKVFRAMCRLLEHR